MFEASVVAETFLLHEDASNDAVHEHLAKRGLGTWGADAKVCGEFSPQRSLTLLLEDVLWRGGCEQCALGSP